MGDQAMRGSIFRMFQVLRDSSVVVSDLDKLDSAIVVCLSCPHWVQVWVNAMLVLCAT